MSEKSSDLGAFLAGFVIGGLVGAATALILAPQSGEETRTRIKESGGNLTQTGSAYIQEYGQKATELTQPYIEKAGSTYGDVKSRLQETGSSVQQQARTAFDASKERANQLRNQYIPSKEDGDETAVNGAA